MANDLDHIGVGALGEHIGGFTGFKVAAVLHRALDELAVFKSGLGLLD